MRGGIDPGDLRFRPRAFEYIYSGVYIWKDFVPGDNTLPSPGAVGPRRCPERKFSPHGGFMSPSKPANQPVGLGFPNHAERYRPGGRTLSFSVCWSCRGIQ